MRYLPFVAVMAATVSGCQTSTGILPAGPNTYTVSETVAPVVGGGAEAQRRALTEADAYCKNQSRVFVPTDMQSGHELSPVYGPTGYSVTFRCLQANDPAVAGYQLERAPDAIIEKRDR